MNFDLPPTVEELAIAIRRWVAAETPGSTQEPFSLERWRSFVAWGLLDEGVGDYLHRCAGLREAARLGLTGPILEAYLALQADPTGRVAQTLQAGQVPTSVKTNGSGPWLVGWGGVANLVLDQGSGRVLSKEPLPRAEFTFPYPHGWMGSDAVLTDASGTSSGPDPLAGDRWLIGSALLSGLIEATLDHTATHVLNRHQFGRPLASFQAVQLPLAEAKVWCDGVRLAVLDAAARRDRDTAIWQFSAALAWIASVRAAEQITKISHQAFGASGFCNETGLVQLTWAMSWLRLSIGIDEASECVLTSRAEYLEEVGDGEPGCLILEGFGGDA